MVIPTLTKLNPVELNHYPLMISLDKYSGKAADTYLQKYAFQVKQKT